MADVNYIRNIISAFIDQLGGDLYKQRVSKNCWIFPRGSITMSILIWENEDNPDQTMIICSTRVMKVPLKTALPFYRKLLELNFRMLGRCAFAIDEKNFVVLHASRKIKDLNIGELVCMVNDVSILSDMYDDVLLNEFGRENAL